MSSYSRRVIAASTLGGVFLLESAIAMGRFGRRKRLFMEASERSVKTGRQLVVVGDPNAGLHTRLVQAYGCGAVCVDLNGCPACPISVPADITKGKIEEVADDSSVVFCCCVLEYVDDVEAAMAELKRMAGAPENLFIVFVDPVSLTAFLYPWGKRRSGSDGRGASWKEVTPWQRAIVGLGLGALAVAAVTK